MFFIASKLIGVLLLPLPFFLVISIIFVLKFVEGKKRKLLVLGPILFLFLFSTKWMSQALLKTLEGEFPPKAEIELPNTDIAIVLGGMVRTLSITDSRPELSDSADRLIDAVRLYRKGIVKKILFSGGSGELFHQEMKESTVAKRIMLDLGVSEQDILIESESRNTYENALYSKKILESEKAKSVLLITSAFHMKRSYAIFKKLGLGDVIPFATDYRRSTSQLNLWELLLPSPNDLEISSFCIKEWIGILAYTFKGYL